LGKHHPKNHVPVETYQKVCNGHNNIIWTDGIPLKECLKMATNVVLVNSSVIFDALLHEKPELSLGNTMLSGKDVVYEYSPEETDSVLNNFYDTVALTQKLHTFNGLMESLFNRNIFFIKDDTAAVRLAKIISAFKKTNYLELDYRKDEKKVRGYESQL